MASTSSGSHPNAPAPLSRRTVLRGAAVLGGTGTTVALAACGGAAAPAGQAGPAGSSASSATISAPATTNTESSAAPTPDGESSTTSTAAAAGQPALVAASRVPAGGGVVLADQKIVVTQPTAGKFKAFSAICTHQGCLIAEVSKAGIECRCHGSRFSIQDGSVTNPPAKAALPAVAVTVHNGNVVRG